MKYNTRFKTVYGDLDKMVAKIVKALVAKKFLARGFKVFWSDRDGRRNVTRIVCESENVELTLSRVDGVDVLGRLYALGAKVVKIGNKQLYTPMLPELNRASLTVDNHRYLRLRRDDGSDNFVWDIELAVSGEPCTTYGYNETIQQFSDDLKRILSLIKAS